MRILFAERRECGKALELSRQIDREYAEAAKAQRERPRFVSSERPGDPISAYYAHLDNIRKHLTIADYSRVDAMIALRMRSNGQILKILDLNLTHFAVRCLGKMNRAL